MTRPGSGAPTLRGLAPAGLAAGLVAAVATTVLAAIAKSSGVDLEIDGTAVPLAAFAWWTVVGAVLGVVLARVLGDPRRFVVVTAVATALSLVPAVALADDGATKAVLVGAHLIAALVVVPVLARRLSAART